MKIVYHTWLCKTDGYLLGVTSRADFTYMFSIFFVDELALSLLQAGSSIMMCLNEDGKMTAEFGFTYGHGYSKLNDVST